MHIYTSLNIQGSLKEFKIQGYLSDYKVTYMHMITI